MPLQKKEYIGGSWRDGIFDNKVVFCTGGSGSICSAQVKAMVCLGANACIVGRNVEKVERVAKNIEMEREGSRVLGIGSVDVRNVQALQAAVERCAKELGSIDFVIAGAAGNFLAPFRSLSPNAFKAVIDIDVLGSFNVAKLTVPYLIKSAAQSRAGDDDESTGGRILFVGANCVATGLPLQTHVSVAKAGINALSNNLAIELGPLGLTSNVVAPGPIGKTEGMDRLTPESDGAKDIPSKIPLGRWGSVKDIANATVYLFSDAGSYVNGDILIVDGGAWRTLGGVPGHTVPYPDFLLSSQEVGASRNAAKSKM